jgi:Domain of unknown function (DUF4055)
MSNSNKKSVDTPTDEYLEMLPVWKRNRAVLEGQQAAKEHDSKLDLVGFTNLLIPFSPFMGIEQYRFYLAEAELPGLAAQYLQVLVGGLLRKKPELRCDNDANREWLEDSIGVNSTSMTSLLEEALIEELSTANCWLLVDMPNVPSEDNVPFCVVLDADTVINYRYTNGKLSLLVLRQTRVDYSKDIFHGEEIDIIIVYTLIDGVCLISRYERDKNGVFVVVDVIKPMAKGLPLDHIPAFKLSPARDETILQPIIDREIGLYNKQSRRNHLLYGAATYTPYVASDMSDEQFENIVRRGLGAWVHIGPDDKIGAIDTPTDALRDMEAAIQSTTEDMARLGARILSPEGGGDSGRALEIKNSAQTAQLGLLNAGVSKTIEKVCWTMIKWYTGVDADVSFLMSEDFNPVVGDDKSMRLVYEWYTGGHIPRSLFMSIAKSNDYIPGDYDDNEGISEIQSDPLIDLTPTRIPIDTQNM